MWKVAQYVKDIAAKDRQRIVWYKTYIGTFDPQGRKSIQNFQLRWHKQITCYYVVRPVKWASHTTTMLSFSFSFLFLGFACGRRLSYRLSLLRTHKCHNVCWWPYQCCANKTCHHNVFVRSRRQHKQKRNYPLYTKYSVILSQQVRMFNGTADITTKPILI